MVEGYHVQKLQLISLFFSYSDDSIFPVVPLHLLQSSFSINFSPIDQLVLGYQQTFFRFLSLTTPFTMLRICFLLITSLAAPVPIAMSFTFFIKLSSKKFNLYQPFYKQHLFWWCFWIFLLSVYWCTNKTLFIIFQKLFYSWSSSNSICIYFNLLFDFFWNCLLKFPKMFNRLLYLLFNKSELYIQNIVC